MATVAYLDETHFCHLARQIPGWRVTDWLAAEAEAFSGKFDLHSYLGFLYAMREFDARPGGKAAPVVLIGCAQDSLFPPSVLQETAARFASCGDVSRRMVDSAFGHDAFLLDESLYAPMLQELFA